MFKKARFVLGGKRFVELLQRLKRKRRQFEKLSLAKQRIAIAKDVLDQLDARKIMAGSTYFSVTNETGDRFGDDVCEAETCLLKAKRRDDIDLSVVTAQLPCRVCGIGSLFLTAVENADDLKASAFHDGSNASLRNEQVGYLSRWFDVDQLNMIEAYFERGELGFNPWYAIGGPIIKTRDQDTRLRMIMENIISNRGKFDPKRGRHAWKE